MRTPKVRFFYYPCQLNYEMPQHLRQVYILMRLFFSSHSIELSDNLLNSLKYIHIRLQWEVLPENWKFVNKTNDLITI